MENKNMVQLCIFQLTWYHAKQVLPIQYEAILLDIYKLRVIASPVELSITKSSL